MSQASFITRFFRFLGRSIDALRQFLGRLIFVVIIVVILVMLFSGPTPISVPSNSLVVIAPKGAIVEQPSLIDATSLLLGAEEIVDTPLRDILDTLERAQEDDRVRGVVLDLREMGAISPANMERIGSALEDFKGRGKALVAHSDFFTQAQYYLASFAETVYLHPMGQLVLQGYGGNQIYFADLLDKLGVKVHIFRVGTHKAAVEPYSLMGMSDASRENNQGLVDELWQRFVNQVAANRALSPEQVLSYANDYPQHLVAVNGDTALVALRHELIDELVSPAQLQARLSTLAADASGRPRTIDFQRYLAATQTLPLPQENEIGVIVAQGTIDIGEQPRGTIGARSLNSLIREARRDDRIKAVVLRVDSPGGSAFASELIRQELVELQRAGKPLIVSMGGTAASGGYWIATAADEIWASPATITGSIGVFSLVPTFEGSLEKLGVNADGVGTTPLSRADILSPLNDAMGTVLQSSVEDQYRKFLQLVADARGMDVEDVDLIAQGQVWTGTQAISRGLVDNLGDLDDAIVAAARLAELEDYSWRYVETPLSPGEQILQSMIQNFDRGAVLAGISVGSLTRSVETNSLSVLNEMFKEISTLAQFNDPGDMYSLCEFCVLLR
jgi:protease-4